MATSLIKTLLDSSVAKWLIETYNGSSLGGSHRSVKAAIDSLNSKHANGADATIVIEKILSYEIGTPIPVRFSGNAGETIAGSTAQHMGVAIRADTNVVDMLCGSYAGGQVHVIRITKNSVGNYLVTRKSASLS